MFANAYITTSLQNNMIHTKLHFPTKLTSSTAEPTVQAMGLPPYVLECIDLVNTSAISAPRQRAKRGGGMQTIAQWTVNIHVHVYM